MTGPLNLQDFAKIAGSDVSSGYVSYDTRSGKLGKAAAHRHMTGSNDRELQNLRNNPAANRELRLQLIEAVTKSIKGDDRTRANIMQFVADKLGFETVQRGNIVDINFAALVAPQPEGREDPTLRPLDRMTVRTILKFVESEDSRIFFQTDRDTSVGSGTADERREMLALLEKRVTGLKLSDLPLAFMSNASIRGLGRGVIEGSIRTMNDARTYCSEHMKRDLINNQVILQQYRQTQAMDPAELKRRVALPSDNRQAQTQALRDQLTQEVSQAQNVPISESPQKGGFAGGLLGMLGLSGLGVAAAESRRLNALLDSPEGGCQKAVFKLRDDLLSALAPSPTGVPKTPAQSVRDALADNLDAVTLLLCQPQAVLERIEGGKALAPFVEGLKEIVGDQMGTFAGKLMNKGTQGLVRSQLQTALTRPEAPTYIPDEAIVAMRAKVVEALVKEIGREGFAIAATSAKGYSTVDDRAVRDMLADLVLDQQTWLHDFATEPGERIRSTMMRHLDALTVLLCEPEKVKGMLTGPAKEMVGSALEAVKNELGSGEMMEYLSPASAPLVRAKLEKMLTEAPGSTLQKLENAVSDVTREACAKLQKLASHTFEKMMGGQSAGGMEQILSDIESEEQEQTRFEASLEGRSEQQKERLRLYHREGIDPAMSLTDYLTSKSGSNRLLKLPFNSTSSDHVVSLAFTLDTPEHRITMDAFCDGRPFEEAFTAFAREHNLELKPITAREEIGNKSLDDLVGSGALDTKSGYGRFMVNVMQRYFAGVSEIDQRSMLSSMIRFATEEAVAPTDTEEVRDEKNRANVARQLGALFKGAGPIMQKLLQQLGSSSVAPEFKLALQDMKCNLLPIPDSIVRTQLNGIIDRSAGSIAQIRVDKSLGAASVGQSLLCTLIGSDGSERPVVIKLLRPDVDTRMEREKDIFLEAARSVPGMEETYLGRLERLMEELDLRIEANNCRLGAAYDKSLKLKEGTYNDVHAMKLDPAVETTKDVMVLERAPGTTVANYMEDVKQKVASLTRDAQAFPTSEKRLETLRELDALRRDLLRHQQEVSRLAFKWVEEGMFKEGFYHGDLHAGNIMVDTSQGPDNKGLTVIDFGNATKLTASDQRRIMRMVYAADDKQPDLFLDNYRKLMKPEHQAQFDAQRARARDYIEIIFGKGDETNVGERISAALMQMQKLGLELPGQIFNFSQCQLLIQGTVTQMNDQIKAIDEARRSIATELDDPAASDQILMQMTTWFDAEHRTDSLSRLDDKAQDYEARALGLRQAGRALRDYLMQIDDKPDDAQIKVSSLPENLRSIISAMDETRARISKDELSDLLSRFDGMAVQYETYVRHWRDLSRAEHETPGTLGLQLEGHSSVTRELQNVGTERRTIEYFLKAAEKFLQTVRHMPDGMSVAAECNVPSAARMLLKAGRPMGKDEFLAFARSVQARQDLTPQQLKAVSTAISNASRMGDDWTYHDRIILPETVKLGENEVFNKRNIAAAVQSRLAAIAQAADEASVSERAKLEGILTDIAGYAEDDYLGISPSIPQELQGKLDSSVPRDKRSIMAALVPLIESARREQTELQARSQSLQESDNGFADSKLFSFALMAGECEANDVAMSREFGTGTYPKFNRVDVPEPKSFVRTMGDVIMNNSWASARAVGIGTAIRSLF